MSRELRCCGFDAQTLDPTRTVTQRCRVLAFEMDNYPGLFDDLTISIQNNRFLLSLIYAMLIPRGTYFSSRCNMASAGSGCCCFEEIKPG